MGEEVSQGQHTACSASLASVSTRVSPVPWHCDPADPAGSSCTLAQRRNAKAVVLRKVSSSPGTCLGSGKDIWQARLFYCTSQALRPGQPPNSSRTHPQNKFITIYSSHFLEMLWGSKETTEKSTKPINETWVRNVSPTLIGRSQGLPVLQTWVRNVSPTPMGRSQCPPVLQLLLASSKNKSELYCMAHTNNWHLSHKKPFKDSRKQLWWASHILSHQLTTLAVCQLKQATTDTHDLYTIEASRPTQQLYSPYAKILRLGHKIVTPLAEGFLVCMNSQH